MLTQCVINITWAWAPLNAFVLLLSCRTLHCISLLSPQSPNHGQIRVSQPQLHRFQHPAACAGAAVLWDSKRG